MPNTNILKGLPRSLAQSYFSTLEYYDGGYMADWLFYVSQLNELDSITIDIINSKIEPKNADIKPLRYNLKKYRKIIHKKLEVHGFEKTFISDAEFVFKFQDNSRWIHCYPKLTDINGEIYESLNGILEKAYEVNFNPLKKFKHNLISLQESIKNLFR